VTRTGRTKKIDTTHGSRRRSIARAFHSAARVQLERAAVGAVANPIVSSIVHAAIAYADALTAKYGDRINQKDHSSAPKVLRDVFGNRLPKAQETALRQILAQKDDAEYGARTSSLAEAKDLLANLDSFAKWAESELDRA
jgi:uncharacterized protein (UPF0332 family)